MIVIGDRTCDRSSAAKSTLSEGTYNVRREMLNKATTEALKQGNFTGVASLHVLRQAASEARANCRYSRDVIEDIDLKETSHLQHGVFN